LQRTATGKLQWQLADYSCKEYFKDDDSKGDTTMEMREQHEAPKSKASRKFSGKSGDELRRLVLSNNMQKDINNNINKDIQEFNATMVQEIIPITHKRISELRKNIFEKVISVKGMVDDITSRLSIFSKDIKTFSSHIDRFESDVTAFSLDISQLKEELDISKISESSEREWYGKADKFEAKINDVWDCKVQAWRLNVESWGEGHAEINEDLQNLSMQIELPIEKFNNLNQQLDRSIKQWDENSTQMKRTALENEHIQRKKAFLALLNKNFNVLENNIQGLDRTAQKQEGILNDYIAKFARESREMSREREALATARTDFDEQKSLLES
jgi:hypothetical protein